MMLGGPIDAISIAHGRNYTWWHVDSVVLEVASLQSLADWQACMWLLMVLNPPIIRVMTSITPVA
jgi:hypothetical protein